MRTAKLIHVTLALLAFPGPVLWAANPEINAALTYYRAFLLDPQFEISREDRDHLFLTNWTGRLLDVRCGMLLSKYDPCFDLMRKAARARVPCDWGLDLTEGPEMLLTPRLAKAKHLVQMTLLKAQWHLQNGEQTEARQDLIAATALARNLPRDGLLVSVLVQISCEALVQRFIAFNFYQFNPTELAASLEAFFSIPRTTVAETLPTEKYLFGQWRIERIRHLQKENPGNDSKVMDQILRWFPAPGDRGAEQKADVGKKVAEAAAGTSEGIIKLLTEKILLQDELASIMVKPYESYVDSMDDFTSRVRKVPNPLLAPNLLACDKARKREFGIEAGLAMVRAAVEFKLHGMEGLNSVLDPYSSRPFSCRRFVLAGVDRGFELRAAQYEAGSGVLIFVETPGTPFYVEGKRAGTPMEQGSAEEVFRRRYGIAPDTNQTK